jgi:zinc D-Ala-D-Ala carboxypeptidase
VPTLGSDAPKLSSDAARDLKRLVDDAAAYGEKLVVASAYRFYEDQRLSHERLASVYGEEGAHAMSAKAGHSQHQLGTAVDFTNAQAGYQVWEPFGQTSASAWLEVHAPEHGFVLAYPPGKELQTGYRWEPWHYRYMGKENASRIEKSGLGLQGFLEREGVSPRC